jgi:hypothetical protein
VGLTFRAGALPETWLTRRWLSLQAARHSLSRCLPQFGWPSGMLPAQAFSERRAGARQPSLAAELPQQLWVRHGVKLDASWPSVQMRLAPSSSVPV